MHNAAISTIEWIEPREGMIVSSRRFCCKAGVGSRCSVSCRQYLRSGAAQEERPASLTSAMQKNV
jgi:hypothetical protein